MPLVPMGDQVRMIIPARRIDPLWIRPNWSPGVPGNLPPPRQRTVSPALRAYAHFAASADQGAVRIVPDISEEER